MARSEEVVCILAKGDHTMSASSLLVNLCRARGAKLSQIKLKASVHQILFLTQEEANVKLWSLCLAWSHALIQENRL